MAKPKMCGSGNGAPEMSPAKWMKPGKQMGKSAPKMAGPTKPKASKF